MNLLMILAVFLVALFTGLGIRNYIQGRNAWKEVVTKAKQSSISTSYVDELDQL